MFQNVTLVGRLGRDPELRYTPEGKSVTSFSLAVDDWRDGPPTWVKVTCWEKLAESVNEYMVKGRLVLVSGDNLKSSAWIDKDTGEARSALELTARNVVFLPDGRQQETGADAQSEAEKDEVPF